MRRIDRARGWDGPTATPELPGTSGEPGTAAREKCVGIAARRDSGRDGGCCRHPFPRHGVAPDHPRPPPTLCSHQKVTDLRRIRRRYLCGSAFFIDVLGVLPFDTIYILYMQSQSGGSNLDTTLDKVRVLKVLRLLRIFRLFKILRGADTLKYYEDHLDIR